MEEFSTFGDLTQVATYEKKARALMKKLDEAQNTIEQFAAEEDAFEWDRTKYPLRSKLANTLTPYFTLYDLIVGYKTKYDKWLHGALTDVDPDQVKFINL